MKRIILASLFLFALSSVGCVSTHMVINEKTTITEKPPYNGPIIEESVGVEWKW